MSDGSRVVFKNILLLSMYCYFQFKYSIFDKGLYWNIYCHWNKYYNIYSNENIGNYIAGFRSAPFEAFINGKEDIFSLFWKEAEKKYIFLADR